jgi:hypothetical protein
MLTGKSSTGCDGGNSFMKYAVLEAKLLTNYEDWKSLFPISLQRFHDYLDYMMSDRNTSVRSESSFITYVNDLKKLHIKEGHKEWDQVYYDAVSTRKMHECRAIFKNREKSIVKGKRFGCG